MTRRVYHVADRNWRKNQSIQQARTVAAALDKTAVILVMIDDRAGTLELATYGINGPRCLEAEVLGEKAYDAVMKGYGS